MSMPTRPPATVPPPSDTAHSPPLSTSAFPYEATLVGLHGSLTPAEMLIPVVVA